MRNGTRRDAWLFAMNSNDKHGLRPTNADKRHKVIMALEDDEFCELPNTKIAEKCGVDEKLVRRIKEEVDSAKPRPFKNPSNFKENKIANFRNRAEEAEKVAVDLKNEIERLRAEKPPVVEKIVEKPAEVDQAAIEKLVAERTAEKLAELEAEQANLDGEHQKRMAKLEELYKDRESVLRDLHDHKMKEIDEAAQAGLDVDVKKRELAGLAIQLEELNRKVEQDRESLEVRTKMKKVMSSVQDCSRSYAIVRRSFQKSSNACGLPVEDFEQYIEEISNLIDDSREVVVILREQIEKIRKGAGLHVVEKG